MTDTATRQPIADVEIRAGPMQEGSGAGAWTDFSGVYTLKGVAPGRYLIQAQGKDRGYADQYYGETNVQEFEAVSVAGSQPVGGIDFALTAGATISGRVTDAATELPVSGIGVRAVQVDGGPDEWTSTDFNGGYSIQGLAPGSYYVSTDFTGQRGYVGQFYDGTAREDDADIVTLSEGVTATGIDFAVKTGATVSGRVTDAATGKPVPNVGVGADPTRDGPGAGTGTDRDGRYVLRGLAPGSYRIWAEGEGYIYQYFNDKTVWGRV